MFCVVGEDECGVGGRVMGWSGSGEGGRGEDKWIEQSSTDRREWRGKECNVLLGSVRWTSS